MSQTVLTGMVYGKVDWITKDGSEFGMFVRVNESKSTRVVLGGQEAVQAIESGIVQKGMMVVGTGSISARCFQRTGSTEIEAEVYFDTETIEAEPPSEGRLRGSINSCLKGTVMFWDPKTWMFKTYLNFPDRQSVAVSLNMRPWVSGLSSQSQERFIAAVRQGRDFTAMSMVDASGYKTNSGVLSASLNLLPTHFQLHG